MSRLVTYFGGLKEHTLNKPHFSIGRHPENDVQVLDGMVSRYHFTIFQETDHFYLIDHSLNGTVIDPQRKDFTGPESITCSSIICEKNDNTPPKGISDSKPINPISEYKPAKYITPDTYQEVLDLLTNDRARMIQEGIRLKSGSYIGIPAIDNPNILQFWSTMDIN